MGDVPEFNDEALMPPRMATKNPSTGLAETQYQQDQSLPVPADAQASTATAEIKPFKFPEHHGWAPYIGRINDREDQRALQEYQVNLGLAEFQQRQQAQKEANSQQHSLLMEDRAIKHQTAFRNTMDDLAKIQASIDSSAAELGRAAMILPTANPQAWALMNQEFEHKKQIRATLEGLAQAQFKDSETGLNMATDYAALSPQSAMSGGKSGATKAEQAGPSGQPAQPSAEGGAPATAAPALDFSTPDGALAAMSGKFGFPGGRDARVENGELVFTAKSPAQKAALDERAKYFKEMGLTYPIVVNDDSVSLTKADEKYRWLSQQFEQQNSKAGFYQAMERTPPKTQDLLDMLQQATLAKDNERAQKLQQIIQASEEKRRVLISDIRKRYETQADSYTDEMNTLRPRVDQYNRDVLGANGINVTTATGKAAPAAMDDEAFAQQFVSQQGWKPPFTPAQGKAILDAVKARKSGG